MLFNYSITQSPNYSITHDGYLKRLIGCRLVQGFKIEKSKGDPTVEDRANRTGKRIAAHA
jgi:hypothetical protein